MESEVGGAWFAGAPAFGEVMIVPASNERSFVQPSDWEKHEPERTQADARGRTLAEQAGISWLLEKERNIMVVG